MASHDTGGVSWGVEDGQKSKCLLQSSGERRRGMGRKRLFSLKPDPKGKPTLSYHLCFKTAATRGEALFCF